MGDPSVVAILLPQIRPIRATEGLFAGFRICRCGSKRASGPAQGGASLTPAAQRRIISPRTVSSLQTVTTLVRPIYPVNAGRKSRIGAPRIRWTRRYARLALVSNASGLTPPTCRWWLAEAPLIKLLENRKARKPYRHTPSTGQSRSCCSANLPRAVRPAVPVTRARRRCPTWAPTTCPRRATETASARQGRRSHAVQSTVALSTRSVLPNRLTRTVCSASSVRKRGLLVVGPHAVDSRGWSSRPSRR